MSSKRTVRNRSDWHMAIGFRPAAVFAPDDFDQHADILIELIEQLFEGNLRRDAPEVGRIDKGFKLDLKTGGEGKKDRIMSP